MHSGKNVQHTFRAEVLYSEIMVQAKHDQLGLYIIPSITSKLHALEFVSRVYILQVAKSLIQELPPCPRGVSRPEYVPKVKG